MVDKAGFENPQQVSAPSTDDIPEALRELDTQTQPRLKLVLIGGLLGLGAIALSAVWYVASAPKRNAGVPTNEQTTRSAIASSSSRPAPTQSPVTNSPAGNSDILLGHFSYPEAPPQELQPLAVNGSIKLRKAAAKQFQAMVVAARTAGVLVMPISGFRSVKEQQHLFFDIKAERGQTVAKRAEVSAPPSYSEHHTGYAVDIGDGAATATNLNPNFDKTRAFKWLSANAARFSFEMSFPKDNPQGVSYEPWHWRFVGDQQSLETFYKAKSLKPRNTP